MITLKTLVKEKMSSSPLQIAVIDNIISRFNDYNNIEDYIKEILTHGCVSGIVNNLIYYHDTCTFYEKYRDEINKLLYSLMEEIGIYKLCDIFHNSYVRWEPTDPLALEPHNQNILAWFGFEETVRYLAYIWNVTI